VVEHAEQQDCVEALGPERRLEALRYEVVRDEVEVAPLGMARARLGEERLARVDAQVREGRRQRIEERVGEAAVAAADVEDACPLGRQRTGDPSRRPLEAAPGALPRRAEGRGVRAVE
jgi:hypothetical protein